ncbi:MAG: nucleoside-diphosphate sugar epimerase/dehydratase [Pseudomonadota bacterium]
MIKFILSLKRHEKRAFFLSLDLFLVPVAMFATIILQQGSGGATRTFVDNWPLISLLMLACATLSMLLGIPRIRLKSFESTAVGKVALFAFLMTGVSISLAALGQLNFPLRFHATFGILLFLAGAGLRMVLLEVLLSMYRTNMSTTRVLIYGAGTTGMQLATALKRQPDVMLLGFVDDNTALQNQIVAGLQVYHGAHLEDLLQEVRPDRVVIAMPSVNRRVVARIERRLSAAKVDIQVIPSFGQLVGQEEIAEKLQPIAPGNFLQRAHLQDDIETEYDQYSGKTILISGAGGSIGSELCRQVFTCNPAALVLFEMSELALYSIEMELRDQARERGIELIPVLGTIANAQLVADTLGIHGVDIILHAAAYKHVPLVEANPVQGLANNVFGTLTLAQQAHDHGVKRFVLVSSDKAVRPANVMGASKRFAELIIQDIASRPTQTVFSIVRFGNVLGSSGSVVPLFQEQVARGGPVTLTHNDVTRYFMTVQEAAQLVLTAGKLAEGGEVFVLDMGQPVRVRRLAEQVVEAAGQTIRDSSNPDGDIEIVTTGLRPGEKMHEELLIGSGRMTTKHEKIFSVHEESLSELEIAGAIKALKDAVARQDNQAAREVILRWVDGYTPQAREMSARPG